MLCRSSVTEDEEVELWILLSEFYGMSRAFVPEQHDHVMGWAANEWNYRRHLRRPARIQFAPVPPDMAALNACNLNWENQGAGIAYPEFEEGLDIDTWARFLAHHGRPGHRNQYFGIIMD